MSAVATIEPRRSVTIEMANRFGMEPAAFEATLRATVVPKDLSKEMFAAFLLVAKQYNLNPITKEIFAFPKQGGGIQPIVSVDGWANLINSHPQADGFEFTDELGEDGKLVAITCKMFRKDRAHPITATEYMDECKRDTSVWKQWPRRMLRHKALIQAARYAFGFAGIVDVDEAEREGEGVHYPTGFTARLVPPAAPSPPPAPAAVEAEVVEPTPAIDPPAAEPKKRTRKPKAETQSEPVAATPPPAPSKAYEDLISESYDELAACESEAAVQDLRERTLPQLKAEHSQAWKDACADKTTELFNAK